MAIATLEDIIRTHAAAKGSAPLGTFDGKTITYAEVQDRSNRVAQGLLRLGVKKDGRVALASKNGPAFFEVLFGARKIGAVQVALNWRLSPDEMKFIVDDARCDVLFITREYVETAKLITSTVPSVRTVISLDPGTPYPYYEDWLADQPNHDTDYTSGPDDVALQLYTSGTTGRPKGAMLMNSSVFAFYRNAERWISADPNGVHLNCLPLFHVGGINWSLQALMQGGHVISYRDFDADTMVREIQRSRVTHIMTVPAVLQMLLSRPLVRTTDVSSLKVIIYGGSAIPEKVLKDAIATFGNVMYGLYGMTEMSFGATLLTPAEHVSSEHPEWLRSVGRPFEGTELKVVDSSTLTELPAGQPGELWFRSPQAGNGYWNRPEASAEIFRADGWYRTGDVGYQVGGYFYITDRLNDMIISGGENIYPAEIERVLLEHEYVTEAAAFGIPDDRWGEAVRAVVVRKPGSTVDEQSLIAFTRERLAHYKCPKSVGIVDALPRNTSGKVLRHELREPYWVGRTRRVS